MPLFWKAPYRTPYDDALAGYNRVREERDHPFLALIHSRYFPALVTFFGGLIIFFLYLHYTEKLDEIVQMPSTVREINSGLQNAIVRSTALESKLKQAQEDLDALTRHVNGAHEETRARSERSAQQIVQSLHTEFAKIRDALMSQQNEMSRVLDNGFPQGSSREVRRHEVGPVEITVDTRLVDPQIAGDLHQDLADKHASVILLIRAEDRDYMLAATWVSTPDDQTVRVSKDIGRILGMPLAHRPAITLLIP